MENKKHKFEFASEMNKCYLWKPKEDISTYELALCMPIFTSNNYCTSLVHLIEQLPENARRHFELSESN